MSTRSTLACCWQAGPYDPIGRRAALARLMTLQGRRVRRLHDWRLPHDRPRRDSSSVVAHVRRVSVAGSRDTRLRCAPSRFASDDPPGSPRPPSISAYRSADQVSPGASTTGPLSCVGHWPERRRCASAHRSTWSIVRGRLADMVASAHKAAAIGLECAAAARDSDCSFRPRY
jgi:hypothetical protein